MTVSNIHERVLNAPASEVAKLIDGLSSKNDRLWPQDRWPAMSFDRPLGVGAIGGHGPIRYSVEAYEPGKSIRFRFIEPQGFLGTHGFETESIAAEQTRLRHVIKMRLSGWALAQWLLVIRPLHDALLEDALDRAELITGGQPAPRRWSFWVRFLRTALRRGTARRPTAG